MYHRRATGRSGLDEYLVVAARSWDPPPSRLDGAIPGDDLPTSLHPVVVTHGTQSGTGLEVADGHPRGGTLAEGIADLAALTAAVGLSRKC